MHREAIRATHLRGDVDIRDEVAAFYATFFKTPLTKPQVEEILNGRP